jgi:rod shape-determining protein MreD
MRPGLVGAIALALIYQTVALPLYALGPVGPDFVLLAVTWAAIWEPRARAVVVAVVTGIIVDAISLDPWGVHAVGYGLAALLVASRSGRRCEEGGLRRVASAAAAAAVALAIRQAILWEGVRPFIHELAPAAASALYTMVVGIAVFAILDAHEGRLLSPLYRRLL